VESEAKYTLIGAFVIGSLICIVLAVMWLSNNGSREDSKMYSIYFKNATLNGLQLNSSVTMKGIKIGNVDSLEISSRNIELVEVRIKVNKEAPVKHSTTAVVTRNLLTGLAFIELQGGTQSSPELTEVKDGETYPVIPEGSSGIDKVASNVPELLSDATEVMSRVNRVLSDENLKHLESTIANADRFSGALASKGEDFAELISSTNETVTQLGKVSANIAKFTKPGDGELAKLNQGVTESMLELKALIQSVNEKSAQISEDLRNSFKIITQDIGTAATGISQASRSFAATSEHLSDLRSLISGPNEKTLGPGEVREKE